MCPLCEYCGKPEGFCTCGNKKSSFPILIRMDTEYKVITKYDNLPSKPFRVLATNIEIN